MLRILLTPVLLLTVALTLCIFVIRQQPYDSSAVREAFTVMEGCNRPCFLGIQPGVTPADEARLLLERHPWVTDLVVYRDTGGQVRNMVWDWNGQQAQLLDTSGILEVVDNRVSHITLRTTIPMGDLWLVYGAPPTAQAQGIFFAADYLNEQFSFASTVTCGTFWQGWITVSIEAVTAPRSTGPYDLASVRRQVCNQR